MDKQIIREKQIEAAIGLLFILPAVIGVICFLYHLISGDYSASLDELGGIWGTIEHHSGSDNSSFGYAAASPTPIFMGLMAIVGGYLLKGNLRYLMQIDYKNLLKRKKKPEGKA